MTKRAHFFSLVYSICLFFSTSIAYHNVRTKTHRSQQQSVVSRIYHPSTALNAVEEPVDEKRTVKTKPKYSDMMRYNDDVIIPKWKLSDSIGSFNSTTMRALFDLKDEVSNNWAKVERTFASWVMVFTSKVERDIKTTFKSSEFISRKVTKETSNFISGVTLISKPLLSLPAAIEKLRGKEDSWGLIRAGVNPLEQSRLLGNFGATSTREKAKLPKKRVSFLPMYI